MSRRKSHLRKPPAHLLDEQRILTAKVEAAEVMLPGQETIWHESLKRVEKAIAKFNKPVEVEKNG